MATPKVLGRILLMPKGTYSASATYDSLDWVRDGDKSWVCKVDGTTGITPTEGTNWTLLSEDGTDGSNGVGIVSIAKTGTAGLVDTYTITYTDGTTSTFDVTNGASGSGSGDMTEKKYVTPATATGVVWKASTAQNIEYTNQSGTTKTGTPSVLVELTKDTDGDLNFEGQKIKGGGGTVDVDGSTIVKNASTNKLEVPIDNSTIVVNSTSNKVEVPLDSNTLEVDSSTHKVKVASAITTKLSALDNTTTDKDKVLTAKGDGTTEWKTAQGGISPSDVYTDVSSMPKDTEGYIDIPQGDNKVISARAVMEVANTKTYLITVDAKLSDGYNNGIGKWCDDISTYTTADSVTWVGGRSLTDFPEDADISAFIKKQDGKDNVLFTPIFETDTNEPIICAGYQIDFTNGRFCMKFGNELTKDGKIGFEVKVVTYAT